MTKVSKRLEHDWVMVVAKFGDGTEAKVKWNRGGEDVTVTPRDPEQANRLSLVVQRSTRIQKRNIREIVDVIERVALGVDTLTEMVDGLATTLDVSAEMEVKATGLNQAKVEIKKSRGFVIDGIFPSGERFELKLNKSSIGLRTQPTISARDGDLMTLVFGIKNAGLMNDEDFANRLKDAAEASSGMDQWIEEIRDMMRPAPRM